MVFRYAPVSRGRQKRARYWQLLFKREHYMTNSSNGFSFVFIASFLVDGAVAARPPARINIVVRAVVLYFVNLLLFSNLPP